MDWPTMVAVPAPGIYNAALHTRFQLVLSYSVVGVKDIEGTLYYVVVVEEV